MVNTFVNCNSDLVLVKTANYALEVPSPWTLLTNITHIGWPNQKPGCQFSMRYLSLLSKDHITHFPRRSNCTLLILLPRKNLITRASLIWCNMYLFLLLEKCCWLTSQDSWWVLPPDFFYSQSLPFRSGLMGYITNFILVCSSLSLSMKLYICLFILFSASRY